VLTANLRQVIFLMVLIFGSWAGAPALGQSPNPSADLAWVAQHLAAATDSLIPLRGLQYREFVAYRMSPDFDGPESHFAISFPQTTPTVENLEATVSGLVGGAVRSQLLKLHLADSDASLAETMLRVGIRRTRLTPDRCPALIAQTDAFARVLIAIPTRGYLSAHAPVHEIVFSRYGTHIRASSQDPGTALVRWALDTLNALNKCAGL
jgi:hypothetical protein